MTHSSSEDIICNCRDVSLYNNYLQAMQSHNFGGPLSKDHKQESISKQMAGEH